MNSPLRVAVVGPCMSGKSELVRALRDAGYQTHHVAQEHSYVPHMWRHLTHPDVLIYLDVDYGAVQARRPGVSWGAERLVEQAGRLAHARAHCDLYIDTSQLTIEEVREQALDSLTALQHG
jgi:chloramphenicol 3-O-phosphotransferase